MDRPHWHIIAYDIAHKKRLAQFHRKLKSMAHALQNSVFAWHGTDQEFQQTYQTLQKIIAVKDDDVRCYRLHAKPLIHTWGIPVHPDGIFDFSAPPLDFPNRPSPTEVNDPTVHLNQLIHRYFPVPPDKRQHL